MAAFAPISAQKTRSNLLAKAVPARKARLVLSAVVAGILLFTLSRHHSALSFWDQAQGLKVAHSVLVQDTDWSRFAYVQYVTNSEYLCNSVMLFESLHRLGSKPDRVLMYPSEMKAHSDNGADNHDGRLLLKAMDEYKVKLVPIAVQHRNGADPTWADSFTKLLAFNQTDYQRVLSLDSDATILQSMDELFLLPPSPVAMPRAYWLLPEKSILSSQVMLVEPSKVEFERVMEKIGDASRGDYDMEIVNELYRDSALILPHRPYDVLTAEWRSKSHENYFGSDREEWDPVATYNEAKYVHFSDWPVSKPWLDTSRRLIREKQPECPEGEDTCIERNIWLGFYDDFRQRRKRVCGSAGSQ